MNYDELEWRLNFEVPKISVRMPDPVTWRLNVTDLKRYETGGQIIDNPKDPDVIFRRKIDKDHQNEIKQAQIDALLEIVTSEDSFRRQSLIGAMSTASEKRYEKEKELLGKGVLPTEISHVSDKLKGIFRTDEKDPKVSYIYSGDGEEIPFGVLKVGYQTDDATGAELLSFKLTQKRGRSRGMFEINIPLIKDPLTNFNRPDYSNSQITNADGVLGNIEFNDAANLIIDTTNSAADDFEYALHEADVVFDDAETRHSNK